MWCIFVRVVMKVTCMFEWILLLKMISILLFWSNLSTYKSSHGIHLSQIAFPPWSPLLFPHWLISWIDLIFYGLDLEYHWSVTPSGNSVLKAHYYRCCFVKNGVVLFFWSFRCFSCLLIWRVKSIAVSQEGSLRLSWWNWWWVILIFHQLLWLEFQWRWLKSSC